MSIYHGAPKDESAPDFLHSGRTELLPLSSPDPDGDTTEWGANKIEAGVANPRESFRLGQ